MEGRKEGRMEGRKGGCGEPTAGRGMLSVCNELDPLGLIVCWIASDPFPHQEGGTRK